MLRHLIVLTLALTLIAGCGGLQGAPNFQEAYGVVDQPCAPSNVDTRCTAHVFVLNQGGEGIGHVTIGIPMKDSDSGTTPASGARTQVSTAKCAAAIPDTSGGGYADVSCSFDLAPGKTISAVPVIQSIDYSFASTPSSSGDQTGGIATLVLAAVAGLLAVAVLASTVLSRRRVGVSQPRPDRTTPQSGADEEDTW